MDKITNIMINLIAENRSQFKFIKIMSIVDSPPQNQLLIERNCSNQSMSTVGSSMNAEDYDDAQHQQIIHSQNIHQQLPPIALPIVFLQPYLQKRKNVLNWIQHYSHHLHLTHSSKSLAQTLTDLYFHNNPYSSSQAKPILCALLMISSKFCDYKVLFANYIAGLCGLQEKMLQQTQLDCCVKLGFDFCRETYDGLVDQIVQMCKGWVDLYQENEDMYVVLRLLHRIAERMYVQVYEWEPNKNDIFYGLQLYLLETNKLNETDKNWIKGIKKNLGGNRSKYEQEIKKTISEWSQAQKDVRQQFRNRKNIENYNNYTDFCIRYFK